MKQIVAGNGHVVKEEAVNIPEAVKKYELSGGNIINVVHYAGIKAVESLHQRPQPVAVAGDVQENSGDRRDPDMPILTIYLSDILDGIKRELIKEGKPFSP